MLKFDLNLDQLRRVWFCAVPDQPIAAPTRLCDTFHLECLADPKQNTTDLVTIPMVRAAFSALLGMASASLLQFGTLARIKRCFQDNNMEEGVGGGVLVPKPGTTAPLWAHLGFLA